MNRKLLINEQLDWPILKSDQNESILKLIESFLKLYPGLKRKKSCKRQKTEARSEIPNSIDSLLKKHIRVGINSVTKELEKNAKNVKCILICGSCKPILTRHLHIMCGQSNVNAGRVDKLSRRLESALGHKKVSALAISAVAGSYADDTIKIDADCAINDLCNKVIENLPVLAKPFDLRQDISKKLQEGNVHKFEGISKMQGLQNESCSKSEAMDQLINHSNEGKETEAFGANFIAIGKTSDSETFLSFNSVGDHIQFDDNYSFSSESKYKRNDSILVMTDVKFQRFSVKNRVSDKNRKKRVVYNKKK